MQGAPKSAHWWWVRVGCALIMLWAAVSQRGPLEPGGFLRRGLQVLLPCFMQGAAQSWVSE